VGRVGEQTIFPGEGRETSWTGGKSRESGTGVLSSLFSKGGRGGAFKLTSTKNRNRPGQRKFRKGVRPWRKKRPQGSGGFQKKRGHLVATGRRKKRGNFLPVGEGGGRKKTV